MGGSIGTFRSPYLRMQPAQLKAPHPTLDYILAIAPASEEAEHGCKPEESCWTHQNLRVLLAPVDHLLVKPLVMLHMDSARSWRLAFKTHADAQAWHRLFMQAARDWTDCHRWRPCTISCGMRPKGGGGSCEKMCCCLSLPLASGGDFGKAASLCALLSGRPSFGLPALPPGLLKGECRVVAPELRRRDAEEAAGTWAGGLEAKVMACRSPLDPWGDPSCRSAMQGRLPHRAVRDSSGPSTSPANGVSASTPDGLHPRV